jgi:hypothetical protein
MACTEASCTIRVYDIFFELKIKRLTSGCKDITDPVVKQAAEDIVRFQAITDHPPFPEGVIKSCPEAVPPPAPPAPLSPCVCFPLKKDAVFTVWNQYDVNAVTITVGKKSGGGDCDYSVTGHYYLAYADLPGSCGDGPDRTNWKRPKKKKTPAEEAKEELKSEK